MIEIPKSEWIVVDDDFVYALDSKKHHNRFSLQVTGESKKEVKNISNLIAEAGTVVNACGLMPSELLAQRDMLLSASKDVLKGLNWLMDSQKIPKNKRHVYTDIVEKAIANCEKKG